MYCVLYAREKAKMKNGVDVMFMRLRVNSVPAYSTVLLAKCSDIVYKVRAFFFFFLTDCQYLNTVSKYF